MKLNERENSSKFDTKFFCWDLRGAFLEDFFAGACCWGCFFTRLFDDSCGWAKKGDAQTAEPKQQSQPRPHTFPTYEAASWNSEIEQKKLHNGNDEHLKLQIESFSFGKIDFLFIVRIALIKCVSK